MESRGIDSCAPAIWRRCMRILDTDDLSASGVKDARCEGLIARESSRPKVPAIPLEGCRSSNEIKEKGLDANYSAKVFFLYRGKRIGRKDGKSFEWLRQRFLLSFFFSDPFFTSGNRTGRRISVTRIEPRFSMGLNFNGIRVAVIRNSRVFSRERKSTPGISAP